MRVRIFLGGVVLFTMLGACSKASIATPSSPTTTTTAAPFVDETKEPMTPAAREEASPELAGTGGLDTPTFPKPLYSLDDVIADASLPIGVTTTADQKGRAGQALAFTGKQTYLQLPWDINPDPHPLLTITAWARYRGPADFLGQAQVVSHDDGDYDRSIGLDARGGKWGWSSFAGSAEVIGGAQVKVGEWIFLVVSYDQTAGRVVLEARGTSFPVAKGKLGPGHPFVWLGGNPSFGEPFIGDIAHVRIFNRILTSAELRAVQSE